MAWTSRRNRRRIGIVLTALTLLAACNSSPRHNSAENEFNAWANGVEQQRANGQANATIDFEEPSNVMQRVVPANAQ